MTAPWWVPIAVAVVMVTGGWVSVLIGKDRAKRTGPIDEMGKVTTAATSLMETIRRDLADERKRGDDLERENERLRLRERALERAYSDLGGDPRTVNGP